MSTVTIDRPPLNLTELLAQAQEIGDMILASKEVQEYLYWKRAVRADSEAQQAVRRFQRQKERFEECQRFGHYHPEYHKALEQAQQAERELERVESIARFKAAEAALDELLHAVSETIAHAVSDSVKVPGNNPQPTRKGCGGGGSCGCGG
ncbi:YlbF family regulator [Paenibacillus thermoaerophilus]|uniref:YlbF family regulator n=1 Tax=Paenibacillus thermoaerophilus TaxID=1215385 RepID=A0ABW2UZQ6_9BACL